MANQLINKIIRLSELPELKKAVGKTIVAYDKNNYAVDLSLIRGKKITKITESQPADTSLPKVFTIYFSDGTTAILKAYNGTDGETGRTGDDGDKGDTGLSMDIDLVNSDYDWELKIVNEISTLDTEEDTHDNTCEQAWSAYRGKAANIEIEARNETFLSDEDFNAMFNAESISYIEAEFSSTEDDQLILIFNNDTNPHTKFHKFWTYEDSDVATYYVYNEVSGTYDPVVVNLWDDIYLGEKTGYFLATAQQFNDGTKLYAYDASTGEYTEVAVINTSYVDENNEVHITHEFDTTIYDTDLNAYIDVHYDYTTSTYTYALHAAEELPKDVYAISDFSEEYIEVQKTNVVTDGSVTYFEKTSEDEYTEISDIAAFLEDEDNTDKKIYELKYNIVYEKVDNSTIDFNGFVTYFEKNDKNEYVEIQDIKEYLSVATERWFILEEDGYHEVKSEDEIDKDDFQNYMKVTIDNLTNEYTFDEWLPVVKYTGTSYKEIKKTYSKDGIDLYTWWEDRKYYTSEYVVIEHDDGTETFEAVYTKIMIPSWIVAEFVTTDEDETILVLNSVKELGDEDNTEIDTSAEDYEEELEETIPVQFMVAGEVPTIYEKNGTSYVEIPISSMIEENMIFYGNNGLVINGEFWIKSNNVDYIPISGADVDSHHILYYKVDETTYKLYRGEVDKTATYYIESKKYGKLTASSFEEHEITLFAGIPQQLPIKFFPYNANNKTAKIEYDPDMITLYEGGRIASMEENGDTYLTITPETGQGLHIHVILTTPMSVVDVNSDGYGFDKNPIVVGDTSTLKALVKPISTSNKKLYYEKSNACISLGEQTIEGNEVSVVATGDSQGTTTVYIEADDGFGAQATSSIEVVDNVSESNWTTIDNPGPNDIHWIEDIYFTQAEADAYNAEHEYYYGDERYVTPSSIKEAAHYEMTILKGVEYELKIDNDPENSSRKDIEWTINPARSVMIYKAKEPITETHKATQADIDNNLANEIDEDVTTIVGEREFYTIKGNTVGASTIHGVNKFNKEYFAEGNENITNTELDLKVNVIQSVENIEVIPSTLSFNVSETKLLKAIVEPETADNKEYVWESSDTSIVTVTTDGIIKGIKPGQAAIYAKSQDGSNIIGTCNVNITVPLTGITFTNGLVYVGVDSNTSVTAEILFNTSYELENPQLNWKSADESIATVTGNNNIAVVHGVSLGSTTIIATDKNNSGAMGTIQINVINLVKSISFESYNDLQLNINDMVVLVPEFTPENASIQTLEYTSSDTSIAKVTNEGIVTAISDGTVEITATTTDGTNLHAVCQIEIIK